MTQLTAVVLTVIGLVLLPGCRAATRVTEIPRVDLELEGGNRGYLVGGPPEADAGTVKPTRQMVQTDVEIPSFYRPRPSGSQAHLDELSPPETDPSDEARAYIPAAGESEQYDTYVVKRGDSLSSIAARRAIYGKASKWRRIFEANRDILSSPDKLRPGMALKIPRDMAHQPASETDDPSGMVFHK